MRSHQDSLQRMGLNRVDMLVIHDLDTRHHEPPTPGPLEHAGGLGPAGARGAARRRRRRRAGVGAQGDVAGDIARYLDLLELNFFIIAGCYTLLDQSALQDIELCRDRGVDIIVGVVFNSGLLAHGAVEGATFNYQPAPPELTERTARLAAVRERHGTPLRAAAMQFPLAHPTIRSVLSGRSRPTRRVTA